MNALISMFNQDRALKYASGKEKILYRRIPLGEPKYIHIYLGFPADKEFCVLEVEEIISGNPFEVWNKTKDYTSLSYTDFLVYFYNKEAPAYAYKVRLVNT